MIYRALFLYGLSLKSFAHRLRHDLAKELVVGICTAVLMATFVYIFNDFLNVEVRSLSETMRARLAEGFAYALLAVAAGVAVRVAALEINGQSSLHQTASYLGEEASTVRLFLILRVSTILLVSFAVAWWAVRRWLITWPAPHAALVQLVFTLLALGLLFKSVRNSEQRQPRARRPLLRAETKLSPAGAMSVWRLEQITLRNPLTQLCFLLAGAFLALLALSAWRALPLFVPVLCSFMAGVLGAAALSFQLEEDLQSAWAERTMGISHQTFVGAYYRLGRGLGALIGLCAFLLFHILGGHAPLTESAKLLAIGFIPAATMPALLFQIDPRRPGIQVAISFVVSLFVITAVFAHWLALLLVPLLTYYGDQTQEGRFYRA